MQNPWIYIGLFLLVGTVISIAPIIFSALVAPRKPNPIKESTYECGSETVGESWVQFKAQYYNYALVFLIFDVETVFLFPWALALNAYNPVILPVFIAVEGVIFLLILLSGLVYLWRKGLLEWA